MMASKKPTREPPHGKPPPFAKDREPKEETKAVDVQLEVGMLESLADAL
jgi:hypothetical protein